MSEDISVPINPALFALALSALAANTYDSPLFKIILLIGNCSLECSNSNPLVRLLVKLTLVLSSVAINEKKFM